MKNILRWTILVGLFCIPFIPFLVSSSLFFPFISTKGFAFRILVEVVFGAWVVLAVIDPVYRPRKSIISWALLTFLIVIGLADIFGVAPVKSFWSNFERMEGYVTLLHLGAFFLVISSFFKERDWTRWWNTSLVASLLVSFYSFLQLAGSLQIHQGGARVDASFGNASYLAVYILIHIFIALIFFFRQKKDVLLRWCYGILIVLQTIVLYYTATRGAIVGLVGGLLIVGLLNVTNKEDKRVRKFSIGGIILLVVIAAAFFGFKDSAFVKSSPVLSRFSSVSVAEIKTEGRAFVWPMAIEGIKEKPFLGWGQENFNYIFNEHYSPEMYNLEPWFDRAHNIFLDWGVSGGILGLLSYLSLYVVLLYSIWKKRKGEFDFNRVERSLLTGLIAAYFFHNFFVFDYLNSYILFISLLAYVHVRTLAEKVHTHHKEMEEGKVWGFVVAPVLVVLILILYYGNIKPIVANMDLIEGLRVVQTNTADKSTVLNSFRSSYEGARLGRLETTEWIASGATSVLQSNITLEQKNAYYDFAKATVTKEADKLATDARYQIITGSFLANTGTPDEGIVYFDRALKLSPGKQTIYFEKGNALIAKKDYQGALAVFKQAYDLEPNYPEARIMYLSAAVYAGKPDLANSLIGSLTPEQVIGDDRIVNALFAMGKYTDVINLLTSRIELTPENPQVYISLAATYLKMADATNAIRVLQMLGEKIPASKTQADEYIKQIQNGTIKVGV